MFLTPEQINKLFKDKEYKRSSTYPEKCKQLFELYKGKLIRDDSFVIQNQLVRFSLLNISEYDLENDNR